MGEAVDGSGVMRQVRREIKIGEEKHGEAIFDLVVTA
jgi:hypothetical protein